MKKIQVLRRPLTSNILFYEAAVKRKSVAAFIGKERLGSGIIEEINQEAIRINGEYYIRKLCAFWLEDTSSSSGTGREES